MTKTVKFNVLNDQYIAEADIHSVDPDTYEEVWHVEISGPRGEISGLFWDNETSKRYLTDTVIDKFYGEL